MLQDTSMEMNLYCFFDMIWPYLQGHVCALLQGCACNIELHVQHQKPIKAK